MTQATTRVSFGQNIGFRKELNQRVNAYFEENNISQRDNLAMYLKTLTILAWVIGAAAFTLFGPPVIGLKILGCILLGMGIAGIGFSIGHDANHGGYSHNSSVNYCIGLIYNLIGLSSYLWKYRHNYLHHTYTNILGHDVDIDGDGIIRMSPHAEHKWYHKFQHLAMVFVYAILPFYLSISDVYLILFKRKYHEHTIPSPNLLELTILLAGKVIWLGIFIGIPILAGYSLLQTLIGFTIIYVTYGIIIGHIFSLAHVAETMDFIKLDSESNSIEDEWAVFQVKTTFDFAPKNWFLNWYLGGLNYQVVHHLFPQICHIHYPQIALILADVCQDFGIEYKVEPTFFSALSANYRWLKTLGAAA